MRKLSILLALVAAVIVMCTACQSGEQNSEAAGLAEGKPNGKKLYLNYCVACHGKDGQLGLSGALNLTESELAHADIVEVVTHGRNTMQSFDKLMTTAEIAAVSDYVLTFQKKKQ